MINYEDECCGCATESYPCLGSSCSQRHVPHMYCDKCEDEVEELYEYDGQQICEDCLIQIVPKVRIE